MRTAAFCVLAYASAALLMFGGWYAGIVCGLAAFAVDSVRDDCR